MEITDLVQQYAAEQQASNSSLTETTSLNPVDTTTAVNADVAITEVQPSVQTPMEDLDPLQEFAKTLSSEQLEEIEGTQVDVNNEVIESSDDEVLDEDDFIKQRTDGEFSSWEELREALQVERAKELKFENETSEALYNLIAEGKINEVADILYNKKVADEIKNKPDEDVLKSYIKFQNPEFDSEDIQAE